MHQGAWARHRSNCGKSAANDAKGLDVRVTQDAFTMVGGGDGANRLCFKPGGISNRDNATSSGCEPSARAEDAEVALRISEANCLILSTSVYLDAHNEFTFCKDH